VADPRDLARRVGAGIGHHRADRVVNLTYRWSAGCGRLILDE
jgi:hypothetical protein